jgi:hypothetical protein
VVSRTRRAFSSKVNYEVDESRSQVLIETEELESILGNDDVKVLNSTWYYDNPLNAQGQTRIDSEH